MIWVGLGWAVVTIILSLALAYEGYLSLALATRSTCSVTSKAAGTILTTAERGVENDITFQLHVTPPAVQQEAEVWIVTVATDAESKLVPQNHIVEVKPSGSNDSTIRVSQPLGGKRPRPAINARIGIYNAVSHSLLVSYNLDVDGDPVGLIPQLISRVRAWLEGRRAP